MENSGGDQLRIWLRNNEKSIDRLDWDKAIELLDKAIELLDNVLDEAKDKNTGADCIDAWMRWAVPRFTPEHLHGGLFIARNYGLGDVYTVVWNDTDTGLDEMEADLEVKINMAKSEMAMIKSDDGVDGGGGVENEDRDEQGATCSEGCSDTSVESASEETREEELLLE
ncbi:uncharacterized protein PG986_008391 [Apiospora aurea]|uniref:Uncharacterized protein n=1 Tax=Apiospora aurea TaxID=335848 RepID=A0ABR1QF91_9PEZI